LDKIEVTAPESSMNRHWTDEKPAAQDARGLSASRSRGRGRVTGRLSVRFLVLFCIAVCLLIGAIIHFIFELEMQRAGTSPLQSAQTLRAAADEQIEGTRSGPKSVDTFRNRLFLLLALTVVCFGALIYLFITRLLVPLNVVYSAARNIADGDLSVNVPYRSSHDTADLGKSLNDIAANFQEVLLVTGTKVGACRSAVKTIEKVLANNSPPDDRLKEQVRIVRQELDALESLVQSFEFYGTRFDGRKVVWNGRKDPE